MVTGGRYAVVTGGRGVVVIGARSAVVTDGRGAHVGHVQLQQYGFRARLIFPSYFRLFLLRASLDQSKTSTKQKTKKPSQTRHTICGDNYSLCREMSA